ncbi:Ger(x)C family spore germination protein [Haloplasma contractile]|uniref:Spore germination protein KC n=1 Tax=Haloplasma contractile SSD-17B TaxID=1033810 RepID=U2FMB8_9MOLU|nr:Ger(x)C family spore germination protein [Haloplasma contractile]ERJ13865.1 spore germination protein KC [Haloplasma contractile SSD-17B]
MKLKFFMFTILLLNAFFLMGCKDQYELNEIAITSALAFDKTSGGYKVTAQVILPSEVTAVNQSSRVAVTTFEEEGKTIDESLRKLTNESSRTVYLGHLRGVVISEGLAKEGIADIIDYLFRNPEVRSDFYIYVGLRNDASDFLKVLTPIEKVPANDLFSGIRVSNEKWGTSNIKDIDEIVEVLSNKGEQLVLNAIVIKGDLDDGKDISNVNQIETPTSIKFQNLVVFYRDQMIATLNEEESLAYNHVIGSINSTIVNVPCENGDHFAFEINDTYRKINPIYNEEQWSIQILYEVSGNINELPCKFDLNEQPNLKRIEKLIEQELKGHMYSIVTKAQREFKSDIFGFGTVVHRHYKEEWKKVGESWNPVFKKINVDVSVEVTIKKTGNSDDSIIKKLK